jgi:microsomal dipeptidase-like Zn-dependent dipeptidase
LINEDDRIIQATEPADIRSAYQGKLAGFPAIEGAHCLGKQGKHTRQQQLDRIAELFNEFGVRYFALTHFTRNDPATSAS